jgi:hypothetical protein
MRSPFVLSVRLEGRGGKRWTTVGGGQTLDDALAFAVASAPTETRWRVAGWNHLYGN